MLALPIGHPCCYACHSNWTPLLLCLPFQLDTTVAMLAIPTGHRCCYACHSNWTPLLQCLPFQDTTVLYEQACVPFAPASPPPLLQALRVVLVLLLQSHPVPATQKGQSGVRGLSNTHILLVLCYHILKPLLKSSQ